jgi:alkylation response protein AidB-like acyl-CoA dehydrogenase
MDDAQSMPRALIEALFGLGVMGIAIPETHGGAGGTFMHSVLVVEALSEVDPAVGVMVDVQNTLVVSALLRWGSAGLHARTLRGLATNRVGAYALSEAGSGSDAFALETRAVGDGDAFRLAGRKMWITNAHEADVFIVFATVDRHAGHRGITAFVVDRTTPGFQVGRKEDKLGIRASSTCELILDDCRVPRANVLGEVGQGYKVAIETLNEGRIGIGAQMVGLAAGALGHAVRHTQTRKQFGQAIADFQGVRFQLARAAAEVEAARLLVYNAARLRDAGLPFLTEAAIAKLVASETAERVASLAVNLHGGSGYVKESPVERLYRDAKIGQIYEGTSNLQLETIAKQMLGRSK